MSGGPLARSAGPLPVTSGFPHLQQRGGGFLFLFFFGCCSFLFSYILFAARGTRRPPPIARVSRWAMSRSRIWVRARAGRARCGQAARELSLFMFFFLSFIFVELVVAALTCKMNTSALTCCCTRLSFLLERCASCCVGVLCDTLN